MFFLGWYSGWNRVINVALIKFNVTDELFDRLFDKSRRIGLSKRTRTNYPSLRIFDFSSNFFTGRDRRWRRRRSKTSYTNIIILFKNGLVSFLWSSFSPSIQYGFRFAPKFSILEKLIQKRSYELIYSKISIWKRRRRIFLDHPPHIIIPWTVRFVQAEPRLSATKLTSPSLLDSQRCKNNCIKTLLI